MVHMIPNQLSTTITDEELQRMSGVLRVGMFAVVEPTMQSACLIDECEVSILRTGFSHGSTSQRERRPRRLWREPVVYVEESGDGDLLDHQGRRLASPREFCAPLLR